jgi:hypothetical protein
MRQNFYGGDRVGGTAGKSGSKWTTGVGPNSSGMQIFIKNCKNDRFIWYSTGYSVFYCAQNVPAKNNKHLWVTYGYDHNL